MCACDAGPLGRRHPTVNEMVMDAWNQRWKSQKMKIHRLASGFFKDFSNLGLAYGFILVFSIHKRLTKSLRLLVGSFYIKALKIFR
jgi:hypothetical protein